MFITFEGIDGSGKTTQIRLLEDYFTKIGVSFLSIREPGGHPVSESIREILLDNHNRLNEISELLLFEAARSELCDKLILPALNSGKVVICDRFYDSTTAYQGYGRMMNLQQVEFCNHFATKGLKPDITFYLEIEYHTSKIRSKSKNMDRMENSGDEFFERVINGFKIIADNEPKRVKLINAEQLILDVHNDILSYLINFFSK